MTPELAYKIKMLPESPGCYLMKNQGQIIYVGKAVNLKNRVRQYFHALDGHAPKVRAMIERIDDFDVILCQTNFEALTLECNLIKLHRPFYNILLKDDKRYPYLRMDPNERYPRLTLARRIDPHDGARYFGPYIGATAVRQVLEQVGRIFPLRTCAARLPLKTSRRPCIRRQIGQCLAPCTGLVSEKEYAQVMKRAVSFLTGDYKTVCAELTQQMDKAAAALEFEQAAGLRDKINDIKRLMERQHAIQTKAVEQDVLAVATDGIDAMVCLTSVRGGLMETSQTFLLSDCGAEAPETLLASFLTQYYEDGRLIPREVIAQALPDDEGDLRQWLRERRGGAVDLLTPVRGEKRALVGICLKNAEDALRKHRQSEQVRQMRTTSAMRELQEALSLPTLPRRIEGYDISNTQGALSVAAMVVFEDGMPAKKAYRHFRIKTVEGANDFASIAEAISRRFTHGLAERAERAEKGLPVDEGSFSKLPDVVLIDGGPEQLLFALRAMREAGADVPMFGLAKRLEEIFLPGRDEPILLGRRSNALHLVQRVRDEAHRFGITRHRALRGKASIRSALADIPGIGPKRQIALLRRFKSAEAVFAATEAELCEVEGMTKAAARAVLAAGAKGKEG